VANRDRGDGPRAKGGPKPEDVINQIRQYFGRRRSTTPILVVVLVGLWLASGIYIVAPDEVGVIRRFGAFAYTTPPGPHYRLPWPVERADTPKVTQVRRVEIGFRTISFDQPARYQAVPRESLMLTGDENIVDMQFKYKIKDPVNYLFNVKNPDETVKDAAEAAMREIVGNNKIDESLTTGKFQIQQDTKALLQTILDRYEAGLSIEAVQLQDVHPPKDVMAAFKDVASAKEDKTKYINDSEGYRNDILPKAKGQAAQITNEAIAYRESKIKRAQGDVSRFNQVLTEYQKAKDITKKRLYIEMMEEILPGMEKVILEGNSGQNLLPFLPLRRESLPIKGE
jgi:membrane protease subunit HflK